MRALVSWMIFALFLAGSAHADGEQAGEFDYYVLSLSWSPTYCALDGDARQSPQCDDGADFGWALHGLWPQYENGWPSYCRTNQRAPSRSDTAAMADIMGSSGSAWHQWKKHGVCSGLSSQDYYRLARVAYEAVNRPTAFRRLTNPVRLPASVVQDAFLADNPTWQPDMLTITCRSDRIQEARLCLTRDLEPRICGRDVLYDCRNERALLDPVR